MMMSKFKAHGLALMAVLALSAIGTVGAQAETVGLEAESGEEATVTGTEYSTGEHPEHTYVSGSLTLRCASELFEGTLEPGLNTSGSVTPTYEGCEATRQFLGHFTFPITVTHNDCQINSHGGEQTEEVHFDNITVDIECPEGKAIEVHVYQSAPHHEKGTAGCTFTVASQQNLHVSTVENTAAEAIDDVDITTSVAVLTHVHQGTLGGLCGETEQVSTYTGATTVRAFADEAHQNQIDLTALTAE